ncbi:sigma-70 family RNA polymerase sigma factor [Leptospira sp. WS92.C1]
MKQKTDFDIILVNSYLEYKRSGDSDDLVLQAEFWIRKIAVYKYYLDEDGRAEVLLKFIQKIEYFSEIYERGGFKNFSAFAIVFWKHLIYNQWKKEARLLKKAPLFLDPDGLEASSIYEPGFESEIPPFKIFLVEVLKNLDPRGILIFKLKHNLFLERRDVFLLKSILLASGTAIRDFLKDRRERQYRIRSRELSLLERMEISHQILFSTRKDATAVSSKIKQKLRKKLLKADSIYTFQEIADWFGWNKSVIKKLYHPIMKSLKNAGIDLEPFQETGQRRAA